jgi:acetyl-CoA C-acetyltransferase
VLDPRTPVLVGAGQLTHRDGDAPSPAALLAEAARLAAGDAHAPGLLPSLDSIRVVGLLSWRYRDAGLAVGELLGASPRHTAYTGNGGSYPQVLVNDAAEDIAAGRCDVVLVGGAEAWRTRMSYKARGERPAWPRQGDEVPEVQTSYPDVAMRAEDEVRVGLDRPAHVYPFFEPALRTAAGRTVAEHEDVLARLWEGFSAVAAGNPHAWSRTPQTAEAIGTPSPSNRMVCWPYPKLMNSNNAVEQAAAVLVCSVEAAERHGVPREQWVFLHAGAEAKDTDSLAARPSYTTSAAIAAAGATVLDLAGLTLDDLGAIDLYSCFPSAVQVAAASLGLPLLDGPLTVTGGLSFAGGPWNNYSTHAIATMVDVVRQTRAPGLVTANSGYLTKHSLGVYAATPSAHGFRRASAQRAADAAGSTPVDADYEGPAVLETWSVQHDREGTPTLASLALRSPSGHRTLGRTEDDQLLKALVADDLAGRAAEVRTGRTVHLV